MDFLFVKPMVYNSMGRSGMAKHKGNEKSNEKPNDKLNEKPKEYTLFKSKQKADKVGNKDKIK